MPVYETQRVQVGTRTVEGPVAWYCNCGAVIVDENEMNKHIYNHLINGEPDNGYSEFTYYEEPIYEDKQVQVGTRDDGHYETQTYVDYYYCDCGARK